MYETIAHVSTPALARVLIAALQAHGFHPLEGGQNGLPGLPGSLDRAALRSRCRTRKPAIASCWPKTCSSRCWRAERQDWAKVPTNAIFVAVFAPT